MTAPAPIRIATRGSPLALAQAQLIQTACGRAFPGQEFVLRVIKTTGDKLPAAALAAGASAKGLFTKEIEEALLEDQADLAVHSLKDLPTEVPAGLRLAAVTAREDVRDVLVYRDLEFLVRNVDTLRPVRQEMRGFRPHLSFSALPARATVATGSTRRAAQVLEHRPDLRIVDFRGNVGTRLQKLAEQAQIDATLLAAAGLARLGIRISPTGLLEGEGVPRGLAATLLSPLQMLPCVGQGALGLEIRSQDERLRDLCARLDHAETRACVTAERAFLQAMGGGCQLAVAAYAASTGAELRLHGVSFLSGQPRRGEVRGAPEQAIALGQALAARLQTGVSP